MSELVPLEIVPGAPRDMRVRIRNGKTTWPSLDQVEARLQVRQDESERAPLVVDLTPHLVLSYDENDLLILLHLTGNETRPLARKRGFYDLWVSDPGTSDLRAAQLIHGPFVGGTVVTSAS